MNNCPLGCPHCQEERYEEEENFYKSKIDYDALYEINGDDDN